MKKPENTHAPEASESGKSAGPEVKTNKSPEDADFIDDDEEDDEYIYNTDIFTEKEKREIEAYRKKIAAEIELADDKETLKARQRAAIKSLFEATGGNIPELYNRINKELRDMSTADKVLDFTQHDFSQETAAFRIPRFSESFNLDGATDFFGMSIGEQELLFDRIGLFKGIVVDHTNENPVDQGYRNAVKYLVTEENDERTKPVSVFYKKPRLSGFFETDYALDDEQRKSQETGVFNMGFGLSASYNTFFTSAAMKAGFSYGKSSRTESEVHIRKVAIISNFFLPKIELSFDTLSPCADDSLVERIEAVFADSTNELARFEQLNRILLSYGHFVPSSLIVGGRVFSSDLKTLKTTDTIENVTTEYAAHFQAAVSTMKFEGGVESSVDSTEARKSRTATTNENQNMKLSAVGGEGAFVNDTQKWVKSMEKYTAWGLVRFDNLVPVIDILPAELGEQCRQLLLYVVQNLTIEDLLERNAHFLFYKSYFERFGRLAQPQFYVLKTSVDSSAVLSLSQDGEPENFRTVVLKPFERKKSQLWYISPSGKIYPKEGYETRQKHVLSLDDNSLVVTQDGYFDNQFWTMGGGMLQNLSTGHYVKAKDKDTIELTKNKQDVSKSAWIQLSEEELSNRSKKVQQQKKATRLVNGEPVLRNGEHITTLETLKSKNNQVSLVLSANDMKVQTAAGKVLKTFTWQGTAQKLALNDGRIAVLDATGKELFTFYDSPSYLDELTVLDNGNLEMTDRDGRIVWQSGSIIYSTIKKYGSNEVLTIHHTDNEPGLSERIGSVMTQPFVGADHQLWYINRNGQIISKMTSSAGQMALTVDRNGAVTLTQLRQTNYADQSWMTNTNGYGPIENKEFRSKLKSSEAGKILSASAASGTNENWEMTARPELNGKSSTIRKKVAELKHTRDVDYIDLCSDGNLNYVHTELYNLAGSEIRGVRFKTIGNRISISVKYKDSSGTVRETTGTTDNKLYEHIGRVEVVDKSLLNFRRNPAYFDSADTKFTLDYISGDKQIGMGTGSSKTSYSSDQVTLTTSDRRYLDMNWIEADTDEKVVGVGFTDSSNRVAPYILVVKK